MRNELSFVVTEDHLKLMKNFVIGWCDDEVGAPEVNPKRPYGNGDVAEDVARIIGYPLVRDEEGDIDVDMEYDMLHIHEETEFALQIALQVGYFKAARYRRKNWQSNWEEDILDLGTVEMTVEMTVEIPGGLP